MHLPTITPLLLALLSLTPTTHAARKPANAILLSQVKSLTLHSDSLTTHRRVSAIPQLKCIGGRGCKYYDIDVMRCKNAGSGFGDEDIQWTCTANIPEEFKLGSTDVICEGYDGPDDPYVLKGSCGVEYRLLLTDKGEEKYGGGGGWSERPEGQTILQSLFMLLFVGVTAYILYSMFQAWRNPTPAVPRRPGGGFWGGGWGGGGGGGNDPFDPPPPYPGYPGSKPGGAQQGWQPGFWTGALGGAAAGYFAGNRGTRDERRSFFGDRGGGYGYGSGGGRAWPGSPGQGGSSRSSSGGSTGARYESTGFGSTSRR